MLTQVMATATAAGDTGAMDRSITETSMSALSPAWLAGAPHRLLFFVGVTNVLAAMLWWALWLVALRWQWWPMPQPPIPAGWGHALVMTYQVLPPFMFGFLLTVFPRWMGLPALSVWHYLPIGLGLLGGQALTLVGLWGVPQALHLGVLFSLAGWAAGLCSLAPLLWREPGTTWHARSAFAAMALGWLGLLSFFVWMHWQEHGLFGFAAFKIGVIGCLLPVYLTVCHRMLPFFASGVVPGYRMWRPMWLLAALWLGLLAHLLLELFHAYAWLWLADLPLLALTALMLWKTWPQGSMPGLLRVLFLGLCWLPFAFALYAAQSLVMAFTGEFVLARAPVHALTVGFFGSLLVAMVTRVSAGHSGRPLAMDATAWFAFAVVQAATVLRIVAELRDDVWAWQAFAAGAWLLAFSPWVLRLAGIYLRPRADGNPG